MHQTNGLEESSPLSLPIKNKLQEDDFDLTQLFGNTCSHASAATKAIFVILFLRTASLFEDIISVVNAIQDSQLRLGGAIRFHQSGNIFLLTKG